jgi:hypothetical protein
MIRNAVPEYSQTLSWSATDQFIKVHGIKKQTDGFNCGPICVQYIACMLGEGTEFLLNNRNMLRSWMTSELETVRNEQLTIEKQTQEHPDSGGESSDDIQIISPS